MTKGKDKPVPTCGALMQGGPNNGQICDLPMGHNDGVHEPGRFALDKARNLMSVITEEQRRAKYASLDRITDEPDYCAVCMTEIKTQCFKGTGICSTNCEKEVKGEPTVEERPKGAA